MTQEDKLTPEEQTTAILVGESAWNDAIRKFWQEDNTPYPEHEEYFIRQALLEAQLAKAISQLLDDARVERLSSKKQLKIATEVFGSNDGVRPIMPKRGEEIQVFSEAVTRVAEDRLIPIIEAQRQRIKELERILDDYPEQAELIGRFLELGWTPPEPVKDAPKEQTE